jgi:hypothetical protein
MEDKSMTVGNYRIIVQQAEGGKAHPPERGASGLPSLNTRKKQRWRPPIFPPRPKPWLLQ